jgi:hypothetical protein
LEKKAPRPIIVVGSLNVIVESDSDQGLVQQPASANDPQKSSKRGFKTKKKRVSLFFLQIALYFELLLE